MQGDEGTGETEHPGADDTDANRSGVVAERQ
ncbi:MAG: hypothetical protein QOH87_3160, partial [Trebonia sp.]|nr:hypothetical protein [Trebonia sp.]